MMRFDFHQRRRIPKLVDRFSSILAKIEIFSSARMSKWTYTVDRFNQTEFCAHF